MGLFRYYFLLFAVSLFAEKVSIFDYGIKIVDKKGSSVSFRQFENGKPLLVIYFSLQCGKCRSALEAFSSSVFLSNSCANYVGIVSGNESYKDYKDISTKYPFSVYHDKWMAYKGYFNIDKVPSLTVVDTTGNVLYHEEGYHEGNFLNLLDAYRQRLCIDRKVRPKYPEQYLGGAVCAACHTGIGKWWEGTKHADAYEKLAKKHFGKSGFRKDFAIRIPAEELSIATTGYGKVTGYAPELHQKHLLGVQCEACHSPAGPHDGKRAGDMRGECVKCHNSKTDPSFEYGNALKKLAHPKGDNND